MKLIIKNTTAFILLASILFSSCKKDSQRPNDPCTGVTISLSGTATPASAPAASDGSISVAATGGTAPYTYSLNGSSTFQATGVFTGLLTGSYSVVAKDANGCTSHSFIFTVSALGCPTIGISTNISASDKCFSSGSVTVTASGSTGYSYSIDGTAFQSSNVFSSLPVGTHTVAVKDLNGCINSASATVGQLAAGPNFNNVKVILLTNCALSGCHAGSSPQNGINFADDCTIVAQNTRIKARAVDGNPSFMPPTGVQLSAGDKQKIVDWINTGGQFGD